MARFSNPDAADGQIKFNVTGSADGSPRHIEQDSVITVDAAGGTNVDEVPPPGSGPIVTSASNGQVVVIRNSADLEAERNAKKGRLGRALAGGILGFFLGGPIGALVGAGAGAALKGR